MLYLLQEGVQTSKQNEKKEKKTKQNHNLIRISKRNGEAILHHHPVKLPILVLFLPILVLSLSLLAHTKPHTHTIRTPTNEYMANYNKKYSFVVTRWCRNCNILMNVLEPPNHVGNFFSCKTCNVDSIF